MPGRGETCACCRAGRRSLLRPRSPGAAQHLHVPLVGDEGGRWYSVTVRRRFAMESSRRLPCQRSWRCWMVAAGIVYAVRRSVRRFASHVTDHDATLRALVSQPRSGWARSSDRGMGARCRGDTTERSRTFVRGLAPVAGLSLTSRTLLRTTAREALGPEIAGNGNRPADRAGLLSSRRAAGRGQGLGFSKKQSPVEAAAWEMRRKP